LVGIESVLVDNAWHARANGCQFRREGCAMTSTLNYAIGAVVLAGLFAIGLAIMIW